MKKKLSSLRFEIKNKTLFKKVFLHFSKENTSFFGEEKQNYLANQIFNYRYNCCKPRSFNEYLGWLKYNYYNEQWCRCADKLGSKSFLTENGFGQYVVKTYKIYKKSSEINLDELPNDFVLKTNHDSGTVFVCKKGVSNFANIFKQLDDALLKAYNSKNDEWVYSDITPVIFAEEFLHPLQNKMLVDYKLFGFDGIFGWGFTGQNREKDTRFVVFEEDFKIQNVEYIYLRPEKKDYPQKPIHFEDMVKITESLSKLLKFVRVDFFETTEGLKIGELTFFSQSGFGRFTKKSFDFKYGNFFKRINFWH